MAANASRRFRARLEAMSMDSLDERACQMVWDRADEKGRSSSLKINGLGRAHSLNSFERGKERCPVSAFVCVCLQCISHHPTIYMHESGGNVRGGASGGGTAGQRCV